MSEAQNQEIESIELSIEQAQETVRKMEALKRLTQNKDFIELIHEGYFEKEASRLVLLKADDSMADEAHQTAILKSIDSIGFFRIYLSTIMQFGIQAERGLADDKETLEEILTGEE